MSHWPFIAAAYAITLILAAWLGLDAAFRLARANRRLAAAQAAFRNASGAASGTLRGRAREVTR